MLYPREGERGERRERGERGLNGQSHAAWRFEHSGRARGERERDDDGQNIHLNQKCLLQEEEDGRGIYMMW